MDSIFVKVEQELTVHICPECGRPYAISAAVSGSVPPDLECPLCAAAFIQTLRGWRTEDIQERTRLLSSNKSLRGEITKLKNALARKGA